MRKGITNINNLRRKEEEMKKKLAKIVALSMAAVSLVLVTVLVTVAFLTSKSGPITNTFTVGDVEIYMDESSVSEDGVQINDERRQVNQYRLVPGRTYTKDPIIHVKADSEASYLFVEINNGIVGIETEDTSKTIKGQMENNNWKLIEETETASIYVYAKEGDVATQILRTNEIQNIPVFETFTVATNKDISTYANAQVVLTAYAIQAEGISVESDQDVKTAWSAVKTAQQSQNN